MLYQLIPYVAVSALSLLLAAGGLNPSSTEASGWLSGAPAEAPVASWVKDIEQELNQPEHRDLFLNDPRTPMAPMVHLLNRAARALNENNEPLARDLVQQALHLLDQGVQKGYYSESDIEPVRKSVIGHLPRVIAGPASVAAAPRLQGGQEPQGEQRAATAKPERALLAQQLGSPLGVPEPGSVSDQEQTRKRRNPAREQRADQNFQVTMGGAKYFVTGEIKDIVGNYYFVQEDETGDEIRLVVNQDSHVICSPGADSGQHIIGKQPADPRGASERQLSQGQRKDETALGSGFLMGPGPNCFHPGDRIKAEVSDTGIVTTMRFIPEQRGFPMIGSRSLGESAGTGELAMPSAELPIPIQDKPGQLDMASAQGYPPKQYATEPIPLGTLELITDSPFLKAPVLSPEGRTLGRIEMLVKDSNTGRIEYAEVWLDEVGRVAIPWAFFQVNHGSRVKPVETSTGGKPGIVLEARQYQLTPSNTPKENLDLAPGPDTLKKSAERTIAPPDLWPADQRRKAQEQARSQAAQPAPKELKGELIRGEVLEVYYDRADKGLLIVKDDSGKEVNLRLDKQTVLGQKNFRDEEPFKVGDSVEALVTPDGHAEEISLQRYQGGMPNEPEAGA